MKCPHCYGHGGWQEDDFIRAIEALKMRGWKIKRNYKDNSWLHQCPECKERRVQDDR